MNIESIELNTAGVDAVSIKVSILAKNKEAAEIMEMLKSGDFSEAHKALIAVRRIAEDNSEHYAIRMEVIKKTLDSYFKTPAVKCLVEGCNNYTHQGRFVGDLCGPCHTMITTGRVSQGGGWIGDTVRWKKQIIKVIHGEAD